VLQTLERQQGKDNAGVDQDIGHINPSATPEARYFNARINKIHGKSFLFLLSPGLDLSRLKLITSSVNLIFKPASFQAALFKRVQGPPLHFLPFHCRGLAIPILGLLRCPDSSGILAMVKGNDISARVRHCSLSLGESNYRAS
jgi:hypothetical protein